MGRIFLAIMAALAAIQVIKSEQVHNANNATRLDQLQVKLTGGSTPSEGNVYALNSHNKFGPICDDKWGNADAMVVCRQLGYRVGSATTKSTFGAVPDDFAMDEVKCAGDEARIQDCQYETNEDCGGGEGAGVKCYNSSVKLTGGSTPSEGNVYTLNSHNKFGPICDDDWGNDDAMVVCRQLGYRVGFATTKSTFGAIPDDFAMDEVKCAGDEARIQDCPYTSGIGPWCRGTRGAGVKCTNSSVLLLGGSTPSQGNVYRINLSRLYLSNLIMI